MSKPMRLTMEEVQAEERILCEHPPRRLPRMQAKLAARKVRHWVLRQDVEWEAKEALKTMLEAFIES